MYDVKSKGVVWSVLFTVLNILQHSFLFEGAHLRPFNKFQLKLYTRHNLQTESSILLDTSSP